MSIEQRLEQVEKQTKRLRIAVVVLATALCGVVSMAATERQDGVFDTVVANAIYVKNNEGVSLVRIIATDGGDGLVTTYNYNGKTVNKLVGLSVTKNDEGKVTTYGPTGKQLVDVTTSVNGSGKVTTYASTGKDLLTLGDTENGGAIDVLNKMGEVIITLQADDYGNGEVGAWNRNRKGRILDSQ